jgi:flagellar biosynthesis protein FliR
MTSDTLLLPSGPGQIAFRLLADHLLVFCRLLGMLVLIPGLNTQALGWQLRATLLVTLAAIITPNVSTEVQAVFNSNQIQQASREEPTFDGSDVIEPEGLASGENRPQLQGHRSFSDWVFACITELCLGLILGIGANLVLQSFRMAGTLLEQQTGMSLGATEAQDLEASETGSGALFFGLGAVLFLIAGGHLLCVSTLLDTFHDFPVGYGSRTSELPIVVAGLIEQSLKLALQLAAPLIATQILVSFCLSYAGSTAPHFNGTGVAVPIRIVTASVVLSLTFSGLSERLLDVIPKVLETTRQTL